MDIVLEQYRSHIQNVRKRTPATLIAFDKAARRFQQHLDALDRKALDMESWDIEEYLAALPLADTTKNTEWIHIGGAYRYAFRRRLLPHDITEHVFLAKPEVGVPQTIPNSDLRDMKARIHCDRQWLEFHLLAYTGMRQGEIRGLLWESVDLPAGTIEIQRAKTGPRYVPVHPALGEVLADLTQSAATFVVTTKGTSPIAYDTWLDDLRDFAPSYTAHWFRRTFVSSMLDNGVQSDIVKQIVGHKAQTVMGKFYAKPNIQVMQRAVLKVYADDPI